MKGLWIPRPMRVPPKLRRNVRPSSVQPRHALLLNPFYPKDAHASFGKHVLTPSLALTSVAAATPPNWTVKYWDENLLQGPPPYKPFPQVVGITVHLTFANRAFELASWYREPRREGDLGRPACAIVSGRVPRHMPTPSPSAKACNSGRRF